MKVRELAYLFGFRPPPRTYGSEVRQFQLPVDGLVEYAAWLHPAETPKVIGQEAVDELRTFLRPGDVAIDIGAHTGDTAIPMALAVGRSGRVLALEPNPYVYPVLERNAALNPTRTVIVPLPFAATARAGPVSFDYSDAGFCNGGRHEGISRWRHAHAFSVRVRGENLQAYLAAHHADLVPRLRYIKVDAEGHDLTILESLAGIIATVRPFVRAEVYRHTAAVGRQRLHAFMSGHGYDVHRVGGETCYRGDQLAAADMTREPQFDIFCVPHSTGLDVP
jgi:FkbM family methyltransferase